MNTRRNARLTFARRIEMVQDMVRGSLSVNEAAQRHQVSAPAACKWLGRCLDGGQSVLNYASSRPRRSPRAIAAGTALLIVELRQRRLLQARIARRAGTSKLTDLCPRDPLRRYEHEAPGDLLHVELGRIVRPGYRVTSKFTNAKVESAERFLRQTVAYSAGLGITIQRLITDNGKAERFIQSTLREWAYAWAYQRSGQRAEALAR